MNYIEMAITVGCYILSGVIYWSNKKKHLFTEEQMKEIKEGIDAIAQGLSSKKDQ